MPAIEQTIRRGEPADTPSVLELLTAAGLPTADLTSADGLLRSLAIAGEYRHRGLGRELVARLERDARADGIAQLVLLTETAESFFSRTLPSIGRVHAQGAAFVNP